LRRLIGSEYFSRRTSPLLLLSALITTYVLAFVVRQIPTLLIEPMKADLGASDVEISLYYGFGIAVVMSLAGVPMGMLVDRGHRLTIMAICVLLWSTMTLASAFTSSFALLLACRALTGCSQAVLTPASQSLIADSFPARRMGLALGLFGMAPYLGTGIAYAVGSLTIGFANQHAEVFSRVFGMHVWQAVFLIFSLPGLPLALWLLALSAQRARTTTFIRERPDMASVTAFFRAHGGPFLLLKLATAFASMAIYSILAWFPSLLIRRFGWSAADVGAALGPILMIAGGIGAVGGGALGDRAAKMHGIGRLRVMAFAAAAAAPLAMGAVLAGDAMIGLALLAAAMLSSATVIGINPSATMAMVPSHMRGLASGLGVLIVNLIGFGLGPTVIALGTDYWLRDPGLLHYSMGVLIPLMLVTSAGCALAAVTPYARCLDELGLLSSSTSEQRPEQVG
jgi:MFS family permease